MAQSNLAREPSMDEILASIRKIIESNEATGPGFPANDHGPMSDGYYASDRAYLDEEQAEDIQLTIDDTVFPDFDTSEPTTAHRQAPSASFAMEEPSRAAPSAPLSLADVAARVRAASERQTMPRETVSVAREQPARAPQTAAPRSDMPQPLPQATVAAVAPLEPAPVVASREPAVLQTQREQEAAHQAEVEASIRAMARDVVTPHLVPEEVASSELATSGAAVTPQPETPAAAPMASSDASSSPREKDVTAILSDAVSEQVSRSFGELALAVDSSPRRSFDEIAEEMLRPMLHEWLDDNLPTLVERLVREEIERVARGPRR